MNTQRARRFIELTSRKRAIDAEKREIQKELDDLETEILDEFADEGIDRISVDGYTIGLRRDIWARPAKDPDTGETLRDAAVNALRAAGLDDYVKEDFNVQSLSAYVRELVDNGDPIPDELRDALHVTEGYKVSVTKGR